MLAAFCKLFFFLVLLHVKNNQKKSSHKEEQQEPKSLTWLFFCGFKKEKKG